MSKVQRLALLAALLSVTALNAAVAAGFDQLIAFGDSTLDTGYFRYTTSGSQAADTAMVNAVNQGATGGWAGNGVMNTTILAEKFGLTAAPVDAPGGGTNYANGGATTIYNPAGAAYPDNICTIQEIENYLTSVHGVANSNALYLIKTGDNDATYFNTQSQNPAWLAQHPNYLNGVAAALAVEVATLQAAGARIIVVRNSYDSALMAQQGGTIDPALAGDYANAKLLGTAEWSNLAADGVHFIPDDNDSLFRFVAQHPTLFGFTIQSVLASNAPYANPHVSACFDILTPAQQQGYLFIDGLHLTTAGQTIESDYTYSLLTAPGEISLLAENVVQGGWARAATIQGQIEASGQQRGHSGINGWTSAGAYSTKISNTPGLAGDCGAPVGGTVGLDFQTPQGLILGAAFAASGQSQAFSTGGGFNQADEAPSLYAAYRVGPVWGNAVLTFDAFQDKISRPVPLGPFTDQNSGNTAGQSVAIALRGGDDMCLGPTITGPVAGMVLQHVYVDGFTETGTSGVTALSFGGQTQNSLVSQLGWRVSTNLDAWQPFLEANWNHEWADRNRTVSTSLTSVAAPTYTMDAAPMPSDWATLSLGAFYRLSPRTILRGAMSAMFANPQMEIYGGELGLNVCF
jgi:outer membrane lipase/esterase